MLKTNAKTNAKTDAKTNAKTDAKTNLNPKISFYTKGPYSNGAVFLEIYNSGNEDVEDIKITSRYQKYDEERQPVWEEKEINRYIGDSDDFLFAKPAPLNILRVGEKKLGSGFRNTAINKLVEVKVSCVGMKSGKTFETASVLETARAEIA
jgi:hypothetical protein